MPRKRSNDSQGDVNVNIGGNAKGVMVARTMNNTTSQPTRTERNVQQIAAAIFGLVFIVVMLTIAIKFPNPTVFQYTVFRIILAAALAGIAAIIPGFIELNISHTKLFQLRAGGALAVFVIVYFFSPAGLVANSTSHNLSPSATSSFPESKP